MASLVSCNLVTSRYLSSVLNDDYVDIPGIPPMKNIEKLSQEGMYEYMMKHKKGGLKYKPER